MFRNHFLWQRIRDGLIIGIMTLTISGVASAAERYAVSGSMANIRSGPGTNYEILYEAEKYYPVVILQRRGNWYQIEDYEGDMGWIYKTLVTKMYTVITTKSKCNIRSGPTIKDQILFISEKGVPFKVIKREGRWIHIQHSEGHKGWIHISLVW
jgi:SH3-like domain-containing protein